MDLVSNFKAAVDVWALVTIVILIAVNLNMGLVYATKGVRQNLDAGPAFENYFDGHIALFRA